MHSLWLTSLRMIHFLGNLFEIDMKELAEQFGAEGTLRGFRSSIDWDVSHPDCGVLCFISSCRQLGG